MATPIKGIHHVQITIPKGTEAGARAFYCDLLQLKEVDKPQNLQARGGFWLVAGDTQIHVGAEDGVDRNLTKAHVAYEVENLETISAVLRSASFEIMSGPDIPGILRFECRDPFGNRIEFVQRQPVAANSMTEPTARFSDRVENYVKFRPTYPNEVINFFHQKLGLSSQSVVADVGSGTGIFSALLLKSGATVYGLEPNDAMRKAAENMLRSMPNFRSQKATAEKTELSAHSIDIVTCAQAFHWFDQRLARSEFARILRPGGFVALIWNDRDTENSKFAEAYEILLQEFGTDYSEVKHRNVSHSDTIAKFFSPRGFSMERFENHQELGFESLKGRLLSCSYAPNSSHPKYEAMLKKLREIFDQHQHNGTVKVEYDAKLFWGALS